MQDIPQIQKVTHTLQQGRWFSAIATPLQDALIAAGKVKTLSRGNTLFLRGDAPCGL